MKRFYVDTLLIDRKEEKEQYLQLALYKQWDNNNLWCMVSWLYVKMFMAWKMIKIISIQMNSKLHKTNFTI